MRDNNKNSRKSRSSKGRGKRTKGQVGYSLLDSEELYILYRANQVVNSISNLRELLDKILEILIEYTKAERGFIALIDRSTNELTIETTYNIKEDTESPLEICRKVIGYVDRRLKTVFSYRRGLGSLPREYRGVIPPDIASLVCIPLVWRTQVTGVIYLDDRKDPEKFGERLLDFLTAFSGQSAMAIENTRLLEEATIDSLTGLYIRYYFQKRLQEEFSRTKRYRKDLVLLIIDISNFRKINNKYGYRCGNLILRRIGEILRANMRSSDIAARYGGDEFAVILTETDLRGADDFINRIEEILERERIKCGKKYIKVKLSFGIAGFPSKGIETDEDLLRRAEDDLLWSKKENPQR